jgi:peptidoglycan/xylan/chitin deacetylase (PgdA/CDA1 family)
LLIEAGETLFMFSALPLIAGAALSASGAAGIHYATYAVRSQWLGKTIWCGREDTASVALTFDDGPSEDTERVLDVLNERGVCATFFMIGREIERRPQTARRVVAEGHEIGNHSYSHPIYLYRSPRETRRQIERTQGVIAGATGVRARFARPPCGVRTPAYFNAARQFDLRTVQWTLAGFDWKQHAPEQIARDVLRDAAAGSIILLHDGDSEHRSDRRATVASLPLIIDGLREMGLRVASLAQLIGERGERDKNFLDENRMSVVGGDE